MISIISPVYNSEPYIEQCLNSILNQSFTDWEWILVDDGSTDRSPELIQEYAAKDTRLRLFTQTNQGPAAARNLALTHVRGEYITFLDSDDWMEENALWQIWQVVQEYQPDMVMWDFKKYRNDAFFKENNILPEAGYHGKEDTREYALDFVFKYDIVQGLQYMPFCWMRAVKTEIIRENDLFFNPKLHRTEDYEFLTKVHFYINDMFIIDEPLTVYRTNEGSVTHRYTKGYMEMIDVMYESVLQLPVDAKNEELNRRADMMYIYWTFVAISQEVRLYAGSIKALPAIRRIISRDRLREISSRLAGIGKKIFGRRFLFLRFRLAVPLLIVLNGSQKGRKNRDKRK